MQRSIQSLPGIGEKRKAQYAKLGIETISDLLRHFPRAYQNRGEIKLLSEIEDGETCPVLVTVATEPRVTPPLKNRIVLMKFRIFDDSASATVTFFKQTYLKDVFHVGMTFRMYGKFKVRMGKIDIASPQFEPVFPGKALPDLIPIYRLTDGLSQKMVAQAVSLALAGTAEAPPPEILPRALREERNLPSAAEAFRMIHRPASEEEVRRGREYFIFESLYLFSLGVADMKKSRKDTAAPRLSPASLEPFLAALPFTLTADQNRCISDIHRDMTTLPRPMARLISGDVGSGKTIVAAAAVYLCVTGGRQAMLMAPTEILAHQHFNDLSRLFSSLGIECALLTGSTKPSAKRQIRSRLADGTLPFVIGTHALLSEGVNPARPGLVITDEQHRFGVQQRAKLADEGGCHPHVLVMSATPIPRSLALILYGDLDVSTIETMPPGRQKIDTFLVNESYRARLNTFIRKQVTEGGQVYIVCPAIEPPEEDPDEVIDRLFLPLTENDAPARTMHYATLHHRHLSSEIFPDLSIGCLHGKMKPSEKDEVMRAFAAGEIQVLVSTTVIEVGVNVPRATLMLVENAERFGLSQLHQLRGRVGRGSKKSYFVLISDAEGEAAAKRLSILCKMSNGYQIAQEDLRLRGPGDFFLSADGGARQSGEFSLGLASLCSDMEQLQQAASAAARTLSLDPELRLPKNAPAAEAAQALFIRNRHAIS